MTDATHTGHRALLTGQQQQQPLLPVPGPSNNLKEQLLAECGSVRARECMTRSPKSQEEEAHAEFAFPRHLALELGVDQFLDALLGHCPGVPV